MKKNNFHFITSLLVMLITGILFSLSVYADDTSLGRTPDGVFPIQDNTVVMESEQITVDIEKKSVECIFVFKNTSKSKNVFMGFPGKLKNPGDELTEESNLEIKNFKTYIGKKELPVKREKGLQNKNIPYSETLHYSEFFTFTIPFKENETITVKNTYNYTPTYNSIGEVSCGYILKTGAMWKGNIGSAKVTFKLGSILPYQLEKVCPGGFTFKGNNLIWKRKNFEPKYDLGLVYNSYLYSEEYLGNPENYQVPLLKQKIAAFDQAQKLAYDGKNDQLLDIYNKAVKDRNLILSLYIKSLLPKDLVPNQTTTLGTISVKNNNNYYDINCPVIGPEEVTVQIDISHLYKGKLIRDILIEDSPYDSVYLSPGNEYIITCSMTDWLDHTIKKTLKYKVPGKVK